MNEAEYQFIKRIEELQKLVNAKTDFDILKISANLRLLLLDGLFHKANARSRIKTEFIIGDFNVPTSAIMWSIQDGLYPPTSHIPHKIRKTNLDGFLSTPIMIHSGNLLTVKDAIKFEANVKGGVHVGEPKPNEIREVTFEKAGNFLVIGGLRPSLRQLISIGRVTLASMKPLYEKLKAEELKP
jgi:hypothetical protein